MDATLFADKRCVWHASQKGKFALPLLAFVIATLLSLLFTQSAYAFELDSENADAAHNNGFTWTIDDSGILSVAPPTDETYATYFEGSVDTVLTIPSTMGGKTVTQVYNGDGVYANQMSSITTLQYPKTVTAMLNGTIGSFANRFTALTDFEFVGEGEPQVAIIGPKATAERGAYFPSTLERFNAGTVDGKYYDLVIPSSVTTVYSKFFKGISCVSAYVPSSVKTMQAALDTMSNLTTVVNASDVWVSCPSCPNITDYVALGSYSAIKGSACAEWVNLKTFEVPASITSIGDNAFKGCTSLESFVFGGNELLTIGNNVFSGTEALKMLTLPESVTTIGVGAFADSGIEAVYLPDSITDIGAGAFADSAIEAVKIPASLFEGLQPSNFTSEYMYGISTGRTSPLFVASFQSDESGYENSVLKTVDLSSYKQTFLPSFMFAGCTALEEIAIPKSVSTIMAGVFTNCTSLGDVYYYGDPAGISIFETQKIHHGLGFDYIGAGSFSVPNGTNAETAGPDFKAMEGIAFYGLGISEGNALKMYAEANNCTYVPYAFLGGGGSSADVVAKFGYSNPDNTISIANIGQGGTPVIEVAYPYDEGVSRTLVAGEDCTVTYTLNGRTVTDFTTPGTYTATIVGDGVSVWGTATATFSVSASATAALRLGGDDRYATMALVSKAAFPEAGSCPAVIVARGDNFPDALAAAGLAGVCGGQVLLTETGSLTAETRAEIARLGATKAYVIGDEYSVTARTFNEIKALTGSATRLGGENRLDTAVKIYQAGKGGWGETAVVATGKKAADSLSASTVAYGLKAPIFLADDSGNLPAAALDAIAKGGFDNVVVLGDEYSVSKATFDKVKASVGSAERIGGANRYATSQLTAQWALRHGFTCRAAALTAGREGKYADALVASSLGGKAASPLLLVDDGADASVCIDKVLAARKGEVEKAYVLGDKYTVSDKLYAAIQKVVA